MRTIHLIGRSKTLSFRVSPLLWDSHTLPRASVFGTLSLESRSIPFRFFPDRHSFTLHMRSMFTLRERVSSFSHVWPRTFSHHHTFVLSSLFVFSKVCLAFLSLWLPFFPSVSVVFYIIFFMFELRDVLGFISFSYLFIFYSHIYPVEIWLSFCTPDLDCLL